MLRYNGMLISVFELLADAREQVASVNASVEALRDFWLAETELQTRADRPLAGRRATARCAASPQRSPAPRRRPLNRETDA